MLAALLVIIAMYLVLALVLLLYLKISPSPGSNGSSSRPKVCILTSVHPWNDGRITFKEAVSLARKYRVELHAPADFRRRRVGGVDIYGLPRLSRRYLRPLNWIRLLYRALQSDAVAYHLHDPELLLPGVILKIVTGKKIVYDIHEDYPSVTLYKDWIPRILRPPAASLADFTERQLAGFSDALVFAAPFIRTRFSFLPVHQEEILNYPRLEQPVAPRPEAREVAEDGECRLIYAGVIHRVRGAVEMVKAVAILQRQNLGCRLYLVGPVRPAGFRQEIEQLIKDCGLQGRVILTGRVSQEEVYRYYAKADVALAPLHPWGNYREMAGNKFYEYMSAGLPMVVSHFPAWENFVREHGCGLTVDPRDPHDLAEKIAYLCRNPELRRTMGEKGMQACRLKYNWEVEEAKLFRLYEKLMGSSVRPRSESLR
ncbi:glycosyltransferase [Calderihabitans maritimus]|uniref:Glycosyltransferase n=1 Tax=Calderihabitans maritimus TaxID=1246530 RepID=A0A1Z5HPA4_9FIRM|nr:glycosyltransferase [Calderihabitans maritimus]